MLPAFRIGDHVVYPSRGVAEVGDIVDKEISGESHLFYVLTLLDGRAHILVPVDRSPELGLRQVVDRHDVAKILDVLCVASPRVEREPWIRRQRNLVEKVNSGNLFEVAEVVRDLSSLAARKPLAYGERRLLEITRKLLVQELAIASGLSNERVERRVTRLLAQRQGHEG